MKSELKELLLTYRHIFSDVPDRSNKYTHSLEIFKEKTFKRCIYPAPLVYQDAIAQEIEMIQ